jgi:antitoxin component YwqK of YwqJK toxin-antitoxin module
MSYEKEDFNPSRRETVNTSYYRNKKGLNELPESVLNKIINVSNYEDNRNINHLDRDFNSRYPKSYLQSISNVIEPHGTIRTYYDNEKTIVDQIIEYRNGVKHGKYLSYYRPKLGDTRINIFKESNYKNGILEGNTYIYYRNGNLGDKKNYKNGKLEGVRIEYFENGNIDTISNFHNNVRHGEQKMYSENGKLDSIAKYNNNGTIILKEIYGDSYKIVSYYDKDGNFTRNERVD